MQVRGKHCGNETQYKREECSVHAAAGSAVKLSLSQAAAVHPRRAFFFALPELPPPSCPRFCFLALPPAPFLPPPPLPFLALPPLAVLPGFFCFFDFFCLRRLHESSSAKLQKGRGEEWRDEVISGAGHWLTAHIAGQKARRSEWSKEASQPVPPPPVAPSLPHSLLVLSSR